MGHRNFYKVFVTGVVAVGTSVAIYTGVANHNPPEILGSPVGVAFVSPSGSDSGVNCRNYNTPPVSYPAANTVCGTMIKLNTLLLRGQTGEAYDGTYDYTSVAGIWTDTRSCSDYTNPATIQPAFNANVIISAPSIVGAVPSGIFMNTHCLTIDGKNHWSAAFNAGRSITRDAYPLPPVTFDWHLPGNSNCAPSAGAPTGAYNTLINLQTSAVNGCSDHLRLYNDDLGPCAQPNLLQIDAYFTNTTQPQGLICSDQEIGNVMEFIGNKVHDQQCIGGVDIPVADQTAMNAGGGADWCNPPSGGSLTGLPTCRVGTCNFRGPSTSYHTNGVFMRGCTDCILSRNHFWGSNNNIRIQATFGLDNIRPHIDENVVDYQTCNVVGTCTSGGAPIQMDNAVVGPASFSFNAIPDDCNYGSPPSGSCSIDDPAATSGTTIQVVGNLTGVSGCPPTGDDYEYNVIQAFSQFTNISACSASLTTVGNVYKPWVSGGGAFKYAVEGHGLSWDYSTQSTSPARNLVPAALCNSILNASAGSLGAGAVDINGKSRPTTGFCDAGPVQH